MESSTGNAASARAKLEAEEEALSCASNWSGIAGPRCKRSGAKGIMLGWLKLLEGGKEHNVTHSGVSNMVTIFYRAFFNTAVACLEMY